MAKATVDELSTLHSKVVKWCNDKLDEKEPINAMALEGPITIGYRSAAKANDISVMRAFLSDNKITADIGTNAGLQAMENGLANKSRRSDNVVALPAAAIAAAAIKEMLDGRS